MNQPISKPDFTNLRFARKILGVTLIELLFAVSIFGILVTIAMPAYINYIDRVNIAKAQQDIRIIDRAITEYQLSNNNRLPNTLSDLSLNVSSDPWGNPYQYFNIANAKDASIWRTRINSSLAFINTDYDLYSKGKDGESLSQIAAKVSSDDIVRANNGRYVGLAADY